MKLQVLIVLCVESANQSVEMSEAPPLMEAMISEKRKRNVRRDRSF